MSAPQKHMRGYIRASRLHTAAKQRSMLEAAGVSKIYVEGDIGMAELLRAITDRAYVICVATLGRLGRTRSELREVMIEIIEAGSIIRELSTGREIANKREAQAAAMSLEAAAELARDARAPTPRQARERGKLGGDASRESRRAKILEERMPKSQARPIWKNTNSRMTSAERLLLMPGWTMWQAYRELGSRGVAVGRPRAKKSD